MTNIKAGEDGAYSHLGDLHFEGRFDSIEERSAPSRTGLPLPLVGQDGNAFAIMGRAQRVMRRAGVAPKLIAEFRTEATSGDYDHLLAVVMEWFDVDGEALGNNGGSND